MLAKDFTKIEKFSKNLSERIFEKRSADVISAAKICTLYLGIPVETFFIFSDFYIYGFQVLWLTLRLSMILLCATVYMLLKTKVGQKYSAYMMILLALYFEVILVYMCAQSGGFRSAYFNGYVQIYMAASIVAFTWLQFHFLLLMIAVLQIFGIYFLSGATHSFLDNNIILMFAFVLLTSILYTSFYRLRHALYIKTIEQEDEIKNREEIIAKQAGELTKVQVQAAIGNAAQMLAHDVRRPFSLLKMAMDALGSAESPEEYREIAAEVTPELKKAMQQADGLVQDVMEVGSSSAITLEPTSLTEPLLASLHDSFGITKSTNIELRLDLHHRSKIEGHSLKLQRVFSNILANALQAVKRDGEIWIKSREVEFEGKTKIELCIGNSNSYIEEQDLPQLFETFFTRGKRGGTGLGLAIAKKIVEAHGGKIWCVSQKQAQNLDGATRSQVEFYMTFLASSVLDLSPSFEFDRNALHSNFQKPAAKTMFESTEGSADLAALFHELQKALSTFSGNLNIALIDDEEMYLNGVTALLKQLPEPCFRRLSIETASNITDARELLLNRNPAFVLIDIDLADSLTGFDLVQEMRSRQLSGLFCMHSNRSLVENFKLSMEYGADAYLPKPATLGQITRILIDAVKKRN